ncbi:hypothetical protein BCV69DRAFT_306849 [Microstroma glucosiphilum]|uniref:Uncharacterized protein n=1 Tax=Pseudomicrostroma glucosiphilum TaxID=1684307 RepID=A0A316U8Z4_9BASI|nr:hypothetical protein BCV69DRAFT_306849 [Pseudomicrostroma glucosiphilum]PWN21730.1 hypothetical protein BCV69DRAFT_306849 [Pseudomicrostroma glucosiphilum]
MFFLTVASECPGFADGAPRCAHLAKVKSPPLKASQRSRVPSLKISFSQNTSNMKLGLSILLGLLFCITTLASSSGDSDSERTLSAPRVMDFRTARKIAHIIGPNSEFILDSSAAGRQASRPGVSGQAPASPRGKSPQKIALTPIISPDVSTTLTLAPPGRSKGKGKAPATSGSGERTDSDADTDSSTGRSHRERKRKGKGKITLLNNLQSKEKAKGKKKGFKLSF